jgi:hypothetical protein
MSGRKFFTAEMDARLEGFRLLAGLTKNEVAARMGLKGKGRANLVVRILDTIQ